MKLDISNIRNSRKYMDIWRLNNILLNEQWSKKKTKEKSRKLPSRWQPNISKVIRYSQSSIKRKVKAVIVCIKKFEKHQISDLKMHIKDVGNQEETTFKISRRKEIIKIGESKQNWNKNTKDQLNVDLSFWNKQKKPKLIKHWPK